jgi:tRNA-specific 2-thiouridylase
MAKIRYHDSGALCTLSHTDNGVQARFYENVKSIAPGQSAVFYEGDDVVGGGWILKSFQKGSVFENVQSFQI